MAGMEKDYNLENIKHFFRFFVFFSCIFDRPKLRSGIRAEAQLCVCFTKIEKL